MKTVILYKSIHHGNTKKIAEIFAEHLNAELVDLKDANGDMVKEYDLIGFGSGIYYRKAHKEMRQFIDNLSSVKNKNAFVFTTSGQGNPDYSSALADQVSEHGFKVIGEFSCKGFDTWGPFKLIGGTNKGKPDADDIKNAEIFVKDLIKGK